jgi:hypothetical protein
MMRKFFVALLVGAVAVGLAAPAFAADLKFTGAYRLRFQVDQALGCFDATPGIECDGHEIQARFRPQFDVETEGGVKGVIRLEIGDLRFGSTDTEGKGATGGAGTDAVNIETKWAYIDFPVPATPLRLRGGLQGFYLPKAIVLDDDLPGLSLYGKLGEANVNFWWARGNNAATDPQGTDGQGVGADGQAARDFYTIDVSLSPVKDLTLNAYLLYDHDMETPVLGEATTGTWFGVGAAGKVAAIRWDLDFVYGTKEILVGAAKADKKGYVIDGGVGMALPGSPLDLEVRGWWATGDENNGGDNEGFPVPYSGAGDHNAKMQIWGGGGAVDINELANTPENTWGIGLIATWTASPALKVRGNLHYIKTQEEGTAALPSPAGDGFISGVDSIGTEVGVQIDYTLYRGLVFTLIGAHLFLGDDTSINGTTRYDDVTKIAGVLNYGF